MNPLRESSSDLQIYNPSNNSSRGKLIKDPIIPNKWKILGVVAVLFSVTLIILAHCTGNGVLPAADWIKTGLKYSAWIVGVDLVLFIPLSIAYYFDEKNSLKLASKTHAARIIGEDQSVAEDSKVDESYSSSDDGDRYSNKRNLDDDLELSD